MLGFFRKTGRMPPHLHGEDAEGRDELGNVYRFPWASGDDAQVMIVQMGSKSTPLIAQLCREVGLRSQLIGWKNLADAWRKRVRPPNLVILSGGEQSVYDAKAPSIPDELYRTMTRESVIFGICYGAQLLAQLGGGEVKKAVQPEYGMVQVRTVKKSFGRYNGGTVVMNHGDEIVTMPKGWQVVGSTDRCLNALCISPRIVAVQFHPEMDHTENGEAILKHVAFQLADCRKDYAFDPKRFIDEARGWLAEKAPAGEVVCGVSGGVDSVTAFQLGLPVYGRRLHGMYVDNGFMREGENEEVRQLFGDVQMTYIDAREEFYGALEAIAYPDLGHLAKNEEEYYRLIRRMNAGKFIETFATTAKRAGIPFRAFVQGTNVADIIETDEDLKEHHNVGPMARRLMEEFNLDVIEPLAGLYKFEIRRLARALGLPEEVAERQPFPGPGLSIRAWGKLDRSVFPPLAKANRILEEVMARHYKTFKGRPCQYYVAFAPLSSTGIMGDGRVSGYAWVVRMVTARKRENYSSVGVFRPKNAFQDELQMRLTTETRTPDGTPFVRVFYEITPKPPSTTEPH